jgi:hypothetical protein
MDEWPNEALVARHNHEIAPLLKRRRIFAESTNFVLYDFWTGYGTVDENVFAYSNRNGGERSIVLYNNSYGSTHGTIHISAASMDKGSGELRQRSLAEGLAVGWDESIILRYRDYARGLEYLRRATDIHHHGLTLDLRGYQYAVLLDWQELRSTAEHPWDRLCDSLDGAGVYNLDEALSLLRLRPLHEALEHALHPGALRVVAELGRELLNQHAKSAGGAAQHPSSIVAPARDQETFELGQKKSAGERPELSQFEQLRLGDWLQSVDSFASRAAEILLAPSAQEFVREFREKLVPMVGAGLRLPLLERSFSTVWPGSVRMVLPNWEPGAPTQRTWAPAMAWMLLRSLPVRDQPQEVFDRLQLRKVLGAIFSSSGMEGEDNWRAAARVRVLLAHSAQPLDKLVCSRGFWEDADVRWLTGVNESGGKMYFNQEATDDLLMWMMLPSLLEAAESEDMDRELLRIETVVGQAREAAKSAGFELERLLAHRPQSKGSGGEGSLNAEDKNAGRVTPITKSAIDPGARSGR